MFHPCDEYGIPTFVPPPLHAIPQPPDSPARGRPDEFDPVTTIPSVPRPSTPVQFDRNGCCRCDGHPYPPQRSCPWRYRLLDETALRAETIHGEYDESAIADKWCTGQIAGRQPRVRAPPEERTSTRLTLCVRQARER